MYMIILELVRLELMNTELAWFVAMVRSIAKCLLLYLRSIRIRPMHVHHEARRGLCVYAAHFALPLFSPCIISKYDKRVLCPQNIRHLAHIRIDGTQ